jgi:hypothetical protein
MCGGFFFARGVCAPAATEHGAAPQQVRLEPRRSQSKAISLTRSNARMPLDQRARPYMLTRLMQFLSRLTTTRYTRALEDELVRLRAENRALINSVLGIAGIAPLRLDAASPRPQAPPATRSASAPAGPRPHPAIVPAPPLRRRSWQQIGRMLEITDARRKP